MLGMNGPKSVSFFSVLSRVAIVQSCTLLLFNAQIGNLSEVFEDGCKSRCQDH